MSGSFQDIERFTGKKAVIAIMASDRNHPEFKKAELFFAELQHEDELVLVTEHHPGSPLHTRFHCKACDFCCALVDKDGNAVMRGDRVPSLDMVRRRLELKFSDQGGAGGSRVRKS